MSRALLFLQIATLATVVATFVTLRREPAAREVTAADATARGVALEREGRFAAAALAYEEAAFASGSRAAMLAVRRARALDAVAQAELPAPAAAAGLRALAETLAGGEKADQTAGAALEVALLRLDGNLEAAAKRATDAAEAGLTSPWLDWQLGATRLQQGRPAEAITLLEGVVKALDAFAPAWHRLGVTYLSTGQHEAAISALQKAIERSADAEASLDLARVFLGKEMYAEAIPHLQTVLRGHADRVEALRLLAAAHFRLGRFELAARTYRQAYRFDQEPRTLLSAAIALQGGGQFGEALMVLDELRPRARELPEIAWQRALVLLDLKREREARAAFGEYLAVAAGRPEEAKRIAEAQARLAGAVPAPAPPPEAAPPAPSGGP